MTMEKRLIYPVIVEEFNDEDGHYFVATSPNIKGMVTQGDTLADAAYWSEDAIATMLEDVDEYPEPQDPINWEVNEHSRIIYVSVDMQKWLRKNSQTVRRTITVPKYLNDLAKENNVNVSGVATEALKVKLGV
ncbi:type II toxin-antitoxin system HicB family antitoxin [Secundilactobacillus muriivasis]